MTTYDSQLLRDLLPDRWATAHPQHVLQARQQESRDALEHRRHPPHPPPNSNRRMMGLH